MEKRNPTFQNQLDTTFVISKPAIEGKGEDSFCCIANDHAALAAVFDGCGGLGSRRLPGFRDHTSAYIAARLLSGAVYDWFTHHSGDSWKTTGDFVGQINSYMTQAFDQARPFSGGGLKLRGSMTREMPATAAIAFVRDKETCPVLHGVWAGDSRVYVLDTDGLAQVTVDDVDTTDALANLTDDGTLNNVVSADGQYVLHHRALRLRQPAMVFAASDGCFGYIHTPMEFEHTILTALENAASPVEFRRNLLNALATVAGDDLSLSLLSFGFGDFAGMKQAMLPRYTVLRQQYISRLDSNPDRRDQKTVEALWADYRVGYERYMEK